MKQNILLKVCGLTNKENLLELDSIGVDFIGLNFYKGSPRFIVGEEIKGIRDQIKDKLIGIFVDETLDSIIEKIIEYRLIGVQLHGKESRSDCFELKEKFPELLIIKVFHAEKDLSLRALEPYNDVVDYFLFDTPAILHGGTGLTFDWNNIKKLNLEKPFFISGGISNDNIERMIETFKDNPLAGVDINSKFEIKPGIKDIKMIKETIKLLKINEDVFAVNSKGYFGEFGGAFIPEMLQLNIKELQENYIDIITSDFFLDEFKNLLHNFVGRPTALYHAKKLSRRCGFDVYLKREDLNHTGAHKINNAIGQALLAKKLGKKRIIAETGAGQHGVATATACALLNLECLVYMGEIDIKRQAPNVDRMKFLGAKVVPVTSGSKVLKDAVNEALRDWISNPKTTHYIIGSAVGPHPFPDMVARFQSVIGEESLAQYKRQTGKDLPEAIVACVGGGSNAIGFFRAFLKAPSVKIYGVEAAGEGVKSIKTAASIASGKKGIFHGALTMILQDSEGQIQEAHSISAGLDYPGIGPEHAHLSSIKRVEFLSATDKEALDEAEWLAKNEGIIPALESAHALAVLPKLKFQKNAGVIVSLSGRGDKDMATYSNFTN